MILVENNSFDMIFMIVFFIIAGTFLFMIIKGISQWHRNNQSPRLTVKAKVVSKRMDVSVHLHGDNTMAHSTTFYYVTFEVKSGDRLELALKGNDYGMLAENDVGELTFQGTRYISFVREKMD